MDPEQQARFLSQPGRGLHFQPPGRETLCHARLILLVASLLAGGALGAPAQSAADLLSGKFTPKQVRLAFHEETDPAPVTLVQVDKVYTDYQRKGFFRIGALPLGVLEGVSFEVPRPERLPHSLQQLHQWLAPETARRLELRQVSLRVGSPVTQRLDARRARALANGQWELLDSVTLTWGTNRVQAAHATLQVAGPQAGQLVLETIPCWTTNLLAAPPLGPEAFTQKKDNHENQTNHPGHHAPGAEPLSAGANSR